MWACFIIGLILLLIYWPIGVVFIVIGFILLAMRGSKKEKGIPRAGIEKKCPFCAELIKAEATVCRFCNRELPQMAKDQIIEMERTKWEKTHEGQQTKYNPPREEALLDLIHDAENKKEHFRSFFLCEKLIEKYPNGNHVTFAKERVEEIQKIWDEKYPSKTP